MYSVDAPRVLHVLRSLNRGGIEKWLLEVLRNTPPDSWSPEFLLHSAEPGAYDDEVRALGGVLWPGPRTTQPVAYARRLRAFLRGHGPYDVIHSHVLLYSGVVLRAAHQAGVPVRIAHGHSTQLKPGVLRRVYAALMRRSIHAHATHGLASSDQAATTLFGRDWQQQPRIRVLDCGFDFSAFGELPGRDLLKQQLGLPPERVIVGNVARFAPVKNHAFLISTFAELVRNGVDAHLLLVGTGALEKTVRRQVYALGLAGRCTFAGGHNDVTRFFGAMDLLLVPSLFEGLAIVTLEAQAAGVPVLASTAVPEVVRVVPGLVHLHSLDSGAAAWARTAMQILATAPAVDRAAAAGMLNGSRFGIRRSADQLALLYRAASSEARHGLRPGLRNREIARVKQP